ncbi:MAG TPA: hypothetical protein VNH15_05105 [Elusimicrobiota bacterium]|nr:hypothetical protein [Elusimicrobiota bacterium]
MEAPRPPQEPTLGNIEAINNIDTARMALRWALERLHALEKSKAEAAQKYAEEAKELREAMALRAQETFEREAYYRKIEEYLSQHLSGEIDATALAKREIGLSQKEDLLRRRQEELERDFLGRKEALEAQARRYKDETEQSAQIRIHQAAQAEEERRKRFDKAYSDKIIELSEREVQIKGSADALESRRLQFEQFYQSQKAELESQIKAFHDSVEDQVRFRLKHAENFITARYEALQATWTQEKAVLLGEIAQWRRKAEDQLPRFLELEKTLVSKEEVINSLETGLKRAGEKESIWEKEKSLLLAEITESRRKAQQSLERILELERGLAEAEINARRAKEVAEVEGGRREELEARLDAAEEELARRKVLLEEEYASMSRGLAKRQAELDALESLLFTRLSEFEERNHSRDMEWRKREDGLRVRDQDWHQRLAQWQAHLNEESGRIEKLKHELLESIQSYRLRQDPGAPGQRGISS